jgi:putative transposase
VFAAYVSDKSCAFIDRKLYLPQDWTNKREPLPRLRCPAASASSPNPWALKLGPAYARRLRREALSRCDIWHLDEVVVTISGQNHWLWRAVDQDGYVLDEIVQDRRDTQAAKPSLRRLLRTQGGPARRITTDKLGSYAAARRRIMPDVKHRSHKGLNNRAESFHLPFRRRERTRQGFQSPRYLQRFISAFSAVHNLFAPPRSAPATRLRRRNAMAHWKCSGGRCHLIRKAIELA